MQNQKFKSYIDVNYRFGKLKLIAKMSLLAANLESNLIVKLIWDSRLAAKTIFHLQRENFIIKRARLLVENLHNKKRRVNAKKIELAKLNGESSRPQMMRVEIIWESGKFFAAKEKVSRSVFA